MDPHVSDITTALSGIAEAVTADGYGFDVRLRQSR